MAGGGRDFWAFGSPDDFDEDCPTEDSCAIDYRDGGWHITEVTP